MNALDRYPIRLEPKRAQPQKLLGISPSFIVDHVVKTAEYYRDVLGFNFKRYWVSRPASLSSGARFGGILLSGTGVQGLARPNRKAAREVVWDASARVTDVEALRDELAARGAKLFAVRVNFLPHTRDSKWKIAVGVSSASATAFRNACCDKPLTFLGGTHKIRELSGSLRGIICAGRTRTPP